uniref:diphosphomevalonate decarboxylase n=1 Tax=Streptomyces iakyrus TaxID=68219 RepID=W0W991_9ACTN|nr:mevalonate diphosphate decarboxylase [Streptomyces iakyrus]
MRLDHPAAPNSPHERPAAGHATAVAHPNIALIKYWGKRDDHLILPASDSLSMTLDVFSTTSHRPAGTRGRGGPGDPQRHPGGRRAVPAGGRLVRERARRAERAVVDTRNTVPTGAGLASSASGFAALAVAATAAYGLRLDATELSRLARRGSGSASRSIFGGFALWHAGRGTGADADLSSYAEPLPVGDLDAALVIAIVDAGPKAVSSRVGMRRTVETSPLYGPWVESSRADLTEMRAALLRGDLEAVGEIAERNALGMHATMLAARPAVRYMAPATLTVLDSILRLRQDGVAAYATMDAGPNVKVLCAGADADRVARTLRSGASRTYIARLGPGACLRAEDGR